MGWLVSGRGTNLFYSQETFGYVTDLFKQGLQYRSIRNNQTVVDLIRNGWGYKLPQLWRKGKTPTSVIPVF